MKKYYLLTLLLLLLPNTFYSQQVIINKKNAEVWGTSQIIKGKLQSFIAADGILYLNNSQINFNVSLVDSSFQVPLTLSEGTNTILVKIDNKGSLVVSDSLKLSLAYKLLPDVFAYSLINGRDIILKGIIKDNPKNSTLFFQWIADPKNPSALNISGSSDTNASIAITSSFPLGEYYFNLLTITNQGDTVKSRTYFTITSSGAKAFDILTDHAAWIDSAIIYEITPYIFVLNGKFNNITAKIPEFIRLGVNTIWLQPVYPSHGGGQGYDVMNYFSVRSDLGTESDLANLIQTAKSYGLKVMFDFVANHSSIYHPYAVNSFQYGTDSHYWDYYQRELDNAPYSQNYNFYNGFINYFWIDLPNLNYNNPEVKKWMLEAMKYWITKYDIDGYRFDAIWGVTARNPQFTKDLRIALKSIKPELLLLAEDKATQAQVFDQRFDAGFDWMPEESWVSHWSWAPNYSSTGAFTIFNYQNENVRAQLLRNALTNNGNGFVPNAKVLHFLDNNDISFFKSNNGVERTKMAAALEFTLNGIPLVYNGDEIGSTGFPYNMESIFYPGFPLDYNDPNAFFQLYQKLIKYRKTMPALYGNNYEEITVSPSTNAFGFRRWKDNQNIFTILNMSASNSNVKITLPVNELNLDSTKNYYLTDLLSGEVIPGKLSDFSNFTTSMNYFSAKVFYLSDSVYTVSGVEQNNNRLPQTFSLNQNYPNPFNPSTTISFNIPSSGNVELKIYDILGREVAILLNGPQQSGEHRVNFNSSGLASGIYIYRINYNGSSYSRKMMVLK
jgi:cyclomaltodextrinase / maltogenic alpha-amylase / neopullulanase